MEEMQPKNQLKRLFECAKNKYAHIRYLSDVARQLDITTQTINNWKNRGIPDSWFEIIEDTFGCHRRYIKYGDENYRNNSDKYNTIGKQQDNFLSVDSFRKTPLITWEYASSLCKHIDTLDTSKVKEWILSPAENNNKTFALIVDSESMFSPHEDLSFKQGEIIYIDPQLTPENNSIVIVKNISTGELILRQLIIEGGKKFIKALNPIWPERMIRMTDHHEVCGVVFFKGQHVS